MIKLIDLRELLQEIKEYQMLGRPTVEKAVALVEERATYPPRICYRVEVNVQGCGHEHHIAWMNIFVEVTTVGIQLMSQRVTSCPFGNGTTCGSAIEPHPRILNGEEEFGLFKHYGHRVVGSPTVIAILTEKSNYPVREYPLVNSDMRTLMMLADAIDGLVLAVRTAIVDLLETKQSFKSSAIEKIRRSLDWALVGLKNATSS